MSDLNISLSVNGVERSTTISTEVTLLEMIRTRFELTGSKECCAEGECGACTMIVDGRPVNSCLVLAVETDGAIVTTIEGLSSDGITRLQKKFLTAGAVQCGFCIPGMVVTASALLQANPRPSPAEVREGLSGNLCRCGSYARICDAVLQTSESGSDA